MATVQVSPAQRRNITSSALLLLAVAVGVAGFLLANLNRTGEIPDHWWRQVGIFVAVAVVARIVVRFAAPYADPVLLPVAVVLTGLGLAMIYRLDMSYAQLGNQTFSDRQALFAVLAVGLATVTLLVLRDHRILRRYTYTFMVVSLVLLALPTIPGLGVEIFGSRVWVSIFGFQFQPAEFAKITLAIFFAGYLVTNRDKLSVGGPKILGLRLPRLRDLGPILVVWLAAIAVLVLQQDLGTSLLLFGLFVAMLYVATNRVSWLVIGALLFVPAPFLAVKLFPHVANRFNVWFHAMDPEIYEAGGGSYQVVQGLFGMANGGLLGTGWGRGYPQLVPLAQSDFILASLAEELGLVGIMAILMLYLILIERGLRAALGTRDGFGKLLASGLAFSFALQVFVVLGGLTRVIPLTGLTAPFIAQGGSSLLTSWIILALLLRISDDSRRPPKQLKPWTSPSEATEPGDGDEDVDSTAETEAVLIEEISSDPANEPVNGPVNSPANETASNSVDVSMSDPTGDPAGGSVGNEDETSVIRGAP